MISPIKSEETTPAEKAGVYLHFPFCQSKCNYCDFYSAAFSDDLKGKYIAALCEQIAVYGEWLSLSADTLYLGGGTPTVLQAEEIVKAIDCARRYFGEFSEITVEANPADSLRDTFMKLAGGGVNRVSLGVQSAIPTELKRLGRRHTPEDVVRSVSDIGAAGINNISVDLMLGIPGQTMDSLKRSVEFCLALKPQHISAYMLKIEPGTPFGRNLPCDLPGDDSAAELYLLLCDLLGQAGFEHYEISNFCRQQHQSRHNLKYWKLAPYLGLGPGAHSLIGRKRFYFPRDIEAFINNPSPVLDGTGGDEEEFIMLSLRLKEGLGFGEYQRRYNKDFKEKHHAFIEKLQKSGLAEQADDRLALTERGFLLSNTIISELL